jgi:predicted transcriptional regulator of viral defense system
MNQSEHILELARQRHVLRATDVRERGWSPQLLIRLHQAGRLHRLGRGLYGLPNAEVTEHQTLIEVCQRMPKAVICLLSALQFHEVGTQLPHEVWVALPAGRTLRTWAIHPCASHAWEAQRTATASRL